MNAIKALSFSVLLSLSVAASAENTVTPPDLSAALEQQIEARMERTLSADLEIATHPAAQVVLVRGEARRASRHPTS
jgi:hypothetical protein